MTLLLGTIAVLLLIAIIATFALQDRNSEVLGFTSPEELGVATRAAEVAGKSGPLIAEDRGPAVSIAPRAVVEKPLEEVLAEKAARAAAAPSVATFYPGNLGVGTTLMYRGVESKIVGVIHFNWNGVTWQDYLAEHGNGNWWRFGVEPAQGMKLDAFAQQPLSIEPGPPTVVHDGETYMVSDSGQAQYRTSGVTNQFADGKYWYYDYESTAGTILSFERFDNGPWVTSVGHHVNPNEVRVFNTGG